MKNKERIGILIWLFVALTIITSLMSCERVECECYVESYNRHGEITSREWYPDRCNQSLIDSNDYYEEHCYDIIY